ncbi:hypothetical protein C427_1820 [Paraglaciecola psychrophila 170]|uniref:Uncharacterized protein n=1 Tax=Paraglaciecola psychrophila 170 TaxID=1129794 RepID=K6YXA2_9ALTE|nr:hypothetical protein C427_1820 [Paraglaciecola psychrophila 170]GAC37329.1 hypothetical protein GPSY_1700 [Paraglaciecola psychrophila 170]
MKKTAENLTKAAELAGTERRTFGKLLKKTWAHSRLLR